MSNMIILKYFSVILILVSKTHCTNNLTTIPEILKRFLHKLNGTCEFRDCPTVGEAQCLKASSRTENSAVYLTALNKCQVNYVKCHTDLVVDVFPIKYCVEAVDANLKMVRRRRGNRFPYKRRSTTRRPFLFPWDALSLPVEPDQSCPSSCPATVRMVCGRCQHGVYKSFMSVCHLRMYQCNHEEEKPMQLVSRGPCPYSAPYLSDPGMAPLASASSAHDDVVSRFITCREKHHVHRNNYTIPQSFKDDPDCQFDGLYSIDKMTSFCLIGCCSNCFNRG